MRPVIRLSKVSLEFEGKTVLREVDWEVREGESWAVIGPNGSGKTSLLGIVNGYRWPSRGEATILGRRFGKTDLRDLRTRIGMVSSYLDGWIPADRKVLELVVSGKYGSTRMWGSTSSSDLNRASSILRKLGCPDDPRKTMGELSQGERQKVMIARSMMAKPKLLTLDEPCEGLDLRSRESFLSGLSIISRRGGATLVDVTHRTDEIPAGFTHALLLRDGMVLASGPMEETLSSRNLSQCFGVRVRLRKVDGRYYTIMG